MPNSRADKPTNRSKMVNGIINVSPRFLKLYILLNTVICIRLVCLNQPILNIILLQKCLHSYAENVTINLNWVHTRCSWERISSHACDPPLVFSESSKEQFASTNIAEELVRLFQKQTEHEKKEMIFEVLAPLAENGNFSLILLNVIRFYKRLHPGQGKV